MCMHGEAGRTEDDSEPAAGTAGRGQGSSNKSGNIFANAASVLSMAAEEISLDDHLEKELANEVELWRMETSGPVLHKSSAFADGKGGIVGGPESFLTAFADRDRSVS